MAQESSDRPSDADTKRVTHIGAPADGPGTSAAAVVADRPLLHTTQLLPVDDAGRIEHSGDAARQLEAVWKRLAATLAEFPEAELVRLHVYAASDDAAAAARDALESRLKGTRRAAVTLVVTPLPHPQALVALDAVAALAMPKETKAETVRLLVDDGATTATVAPQGRRIYISGQAEKGTDLASATRLTLESLARTLEFLKRDAARDTVHVKAFLAPMSDAEVVRREVRKFFGERVPPLVLVEWESTLPIEIELVAHGGPAETTAPVVEYLTPPGMSASPVYCRVAVVNHGPVIYVSGLTAEAADAAEQEVADVFRQLERITGAAGGDLKHLVKATYYVSTDEASAALNALRPRYYDPQRPPAASKAMVGSIGVPKRGLVLDMIAVPVP